MQTISYPMPATFYHPFQKTDLSKINISNDQNSSLINPDETTLIIHKYELKIGKKHPGCIIITPVFISETLLSDYPIFDDSININDTFNEIKYIGSEEINEQTLQKGFKLNEKLIKSIFSEKIPKNSIFNFGTFVKKIINSSKIEQKNEIDFKNYFFLPIPNEFTTKLLVSDIILSFYNRQIEKSLTESKNNKNENDLKVESFLVLRRKILIDELKCYKSYIYLEKNINIATFKLLDYITLISPFVFNSKNVQSSSPDEFMKWLKFSNNHVKTALKKTILQLIEDDFFEEIFENKGFFGPLLKLAKKYQNNNFLLKSEFLFCCKMNKISSFCESNSIDQTNTEIINHEELEITKNLIKGFISPSELVFVLKESTKTTLFNSQELTNAMFCIPHLINFEKSVVFIEFKKYFNFSHIPFKNLFCALQTSAVNHQFNYENFETLGDSTLKFLVCLHLFASTNDSEAEMSIKKDIMVGNKHLKDCALEHGVIYFCRSSKQLSKNYLPSNFIINKSILTDLENNFIINKITNPQKFGQKSIADIIEAVIGAAFVAQYKINNCLQIIKKFGILDRFDYCCFEQSFNQKVIIEESLMHYFLSRKEEINFDFSNDDLFLMFKKNSIEKKSIELKNDSFFEKNPTEMQNFDTKERINQNLTNEKTKSIFLENETKKEIYENFQKHKLGYCFKDNSLFFNAIDVKSDQFQRLEFFGDSVLELFLISNIYEIMTILKKNISPEILHNAKLALLTSFQFSRFAVHFGLQHVLINLTAENKNEIEEYTKSYITSKPFFKNNNVHKEKTESYVYSCPILEDAFEAIIGAAFLDGHWIAVHSILDNIFSAYFIFFAQYHQNLSLDLKSDVYNFFQKRGIKCENVNFFQKGKHFCTYRIFNKGEVVDIGNGSAADEVSAAKIALSECVKFIKKNKKMYQ